MKKRHNQRLVLGCIELTTEILRLVNKLIELLNVTINYTDLHERKVGFKI